MNILMLVPSIYMLEVYDRVLTSRNEFTLLMLSLIMLFLYLVYGALEGVRGHAVIKVGEALDASLNQKIYEAAFQANLKNRTVNAGLAINDLSTIRQFVTGPTLFSIFDAPWFPIYLLVTFLFNFWLGLFSTLSVGALLALALLNERLTKEMLNEANHAANASSIQATSNLRNAEVIGAMGMLPSLRSRWYATHQQFIKKQAEASHLAANISAVTRVIRLTLQSLVLGFAAYLVLRNELSPGMMIAASILLGRALAPVEQVIGGWKSFRGALSAYERLNKLLNSTNVQSTPMPLPDPRGFINLESVFSAPPGQTKPFLVNASFDLQPGDVLGIIGPSASGKSTLIRTIIGIWPVLSGTVRLDSADIQQRDRSEIGRFFGYVPQDVELFPGTIGENIARFNSIDPNAVVNAAQMAGVHEMILRLPDGYETKLGENGAGLSGGQMQRIALARALYGKPVILVLDEPNSNLDEIGERALVEAIKMASRNGTTTLVVTHKLSILGCTSKLLLLNQGQVQAFGPRDEVLAKIRANSQGVSQSSTNNSRTGGTA